MSELSSTGACLNLQGYPKNVTADQLLLIDQHRDRSGPSPQQSMTDQARSSVQQVLQAVTTASERALAILQSSHESSDADYSHAIKVISSSLHMLQGMEQDLLEEQEVTGNDTSSDRKQVQRMITELTSDKSRIQRQYSALLLSKSSRFPQQQTTTSPSIASRDNSPATQSSRSHVTFGGSPTTEKSAGEGASRSQLHSTLNRSAEPIIAMSDADLRSNSVTGSHQFHSMTPFTSQL